MKNLLKLGLFGLAVYGIYAYTIGKTLKKLELYFEDIGKLKYKSGHMYLYISLGVENPNKQNITINELSFNILQGNNQVGRVTKYDANITVAGRTRRSIKNIEVRVNLISVAANVIRLFSNQTTGSQEFTVTGYLKAGNMTIPVNEKITAIQ